MSNADRNMQEHYAGSFFALMLVFFSIDPPAKQFFFYATEVSFDVLPAQNFTMKQGEINPLSHHFSLSLHLDQSVSQTMLLLSGTFFLNLFVTAHLVPSLL